MKNYYITWINATDTGERARGAIPGTFPTKVKGATIHGGQGRLTILASSVRDAFDKFKALYPNFKDGEGSFFVQVSNRLDIDGSEEYASVNVSKKGKVDFELSY